MADQRKPNFAEALKGSSGSVRGRPRPRVNVNLVGAAAAGGMPGSANQHPNAGGMPSTSSSSQREEIVAAGPAPGVSGPQPAAPVQNIWQRRMMENTVKQLAAMNTSDSPTASSATATPASTPRSSSSVVTSTSTVVPTPEKPDSVAGTVVSRRQTKITHGGEQYQMKEVGGSEKLKVLDKAIDPKYSIRPLRLRNEPSSCQRMTVVANHFPVTFNKTNFPEIVYHYDVVIAPKESKETKGALPELSETTVPDRLLHVVWKEFEARFYKQLGGSRLPFDGKKNCYSVKRLDFGEGGQAVWSGDLRMKDPDDDDKFRSFRIQLKYAGEVKTELMFNYLRTYRTFERCELPQEVIQALDVALRYCPAINYTPCNRSFYSDQNPSRISDLLELWFGHNQSLLLGRDEKATLNIDMANKAFIKRMKVTQLFDILLRKKQDDLTLRKWTPTQIKQGNDFLKGKLLQYGTGKFVNGQYEKKHRFVCNKIVENDDSDTYKFPLEGKLISIVEYFRDSKGIKLQHPDWPVIHVGNKNMTNFVPLELLEIVPQAYKGKLEARDTSEMIKGAAKPPTDRFNRILNSRNNCGFEKCPILKEFGMDVGDKMVKINDAKKLPLPELQYCNPKGQLVSLTPPDKDGKFRVNRFVEPAAVPKVAVMNVSGKLNEGNEKLIKNFLQQLGKEAANRGLSPPTGVEKLFADAMIFHVQARAVRAQSELGKKVNECLLNMKKRGVGLALVIMGKDGNEYPTVKAEAEVKVGMLTQCVKWGSVEKVNGQGGNQVVVNILLKLNAKLNGVSFKLGRSCLEEFKFLKEPIMFLGADVTHPAQNSKSPSVAAITASYDITGMCYQMHIQPQPKKDGTKKDGAQEVIAIDKLTDIICKMIKKYKEYSRRLPKRIIMFRDGVSEGQFKEIKKKEFEDGIKRACQTIADDFPGERFDPLITFIVVKKRHHTRFTPVNAADGVRPKGNIPPGTVVDTVITHPTEKEWFLNSHVGIQGTSKPSRYHVIHDDCNFTMEQLEKLTYYLCYTFVRCTQPVSYPAPTYYAHLAAFRARALLENEGENADLKTLKRKMTFHPDLVKYPMFFV